MDYSERCVFTLHDSWAAFLEARDAKRIVLFTTQGADSLHAFDFRHDDILLFGSESAGAPPWVHQRADARVAIPMAQGSRSLNLVVGAAMGLSEALRQTQQWPAAIASASPGGCANREP